jgi:membrane peptidoglycan carboxypeptidase
MTMQERQRVVLDYMNSTPLTARAGLGEVNGLGDGLWAWYGVELAAVVNLLSQQASDIDLFTKQAEAYKQVLSLILAQRRPSYYLITNRAALNELANKYLNLMASAGIITPSLQKVATALPLVAA